MTEQGYDIGDIGATFEEIAEQCNQVHMELKEGPLPAVPDRHVLKEFVKTVGEDIQTLRAMLDDLELIGQTGTINGKSVAAWCRGWEATPTTTWKFAFQFHVNDLTEQDRYNLRVAIGEEIPRVSELAWDPTGQHLTGVTDRDPDTWKVNAWNRIHGVTGTCPHALTFTKSIEHPKQVFQPGPVPPTT